MKPFHAKRLLKLADFLETVPKKRFDYNHYVGEDWGGAPDLSCGTTACALGWAATIPEFRRLGLRLYACPTFGGGVGLKDDVDKYGSEGRASRRIFGLSYDEHEFLFVPNDGYEKGKPDSDATPKQVAKHIRKFVKKKMAGK